MAQKKRQVKQAVSLGPHPTLGAVLAVASALLLGMGPVFAKQTLNHGAGLLFIILMRGIVPMVMLTLFAKTARTPLALHKIPKKAMILVGISLSVTSFSYMGAIVFISPNLAVILLYLFPLFVLAVASIRDRTRPSWPVIFAYLLAFAGLVIVMGGGITNIDPRGVILGICTAIGATMLFFVAHIAGPEAKSHSLTFVGSVSLTVAALALTPFFGFSPPHSIIGWQALIAGSVSYTLGIMAIIMATQYLRPDVTSLIVNVEPFVVLAAAWLVLGDSLTQVQFLGMCVVIAAVSLGGILAHRQSLHETESSVTLEHLD